MPQGKFKNKSQVSFVKKKKNDQNKSRKGTYFNCRNSLLSIITRLIKYYLTFFIIKNRTNCTYYFTF